MSDKNKRILIIGPGKMGTALSRSLSDAGYNHVSLLGRSDEVQEGAEIVFVTTPDTELKQAVSRFSVEHLQGMYFIHCSGTVSSSVFNDMREKGGLVASFHPIQSVTRETSGFRGTTFDMEGDKEVLTFLNDLASDMGAKTMIVNEKQKKSLHISAVIASNYLVTLNELAVEASETTGLDAAQVKEALLPLMRSVLDNLENTSPKEALTGPIERGDVDTVAEHIELLRGKPQLLNTYKLMGRLTLDLTDHDKDLKNVLLKLLQ